MIFATEALLNDFAKTINGHRFVIQFCRYILLITVFKDLKKIVIEAHTLMKNLNRGLEMLDLGLLNLSMKAVEKLWQ